MAELIPVLSGPVDRRNDIRKKVLEGLEESFPLKARNKTLEINYAD